VLKFKRQSEELLMQSGLAYTILRPGRLTDGPYTSYDLNTLLKATAGNKQDVQIAAKDELNGETSRIALAGMLACICRALSMHNFPVLFVREFNPYAFFLVNYSTCLTVCQSC
jgi:hypothetical protein